MKTQLIITNRFKRAIYKKRTFLMTLLLPIIAVILGSLANTLSTPQLNIAVGSDFSRNEAMALAQKLTVVEGVNSRYLDSTNYKTDLIMGAYDIALKLHSDGSIDYWTIRKSEEEPKIRQLIHDVQIHPKQTFTIADYLDVHPLSSIEKILSFMMLMLLITCTVNSSFIIYDKQLGLYERVKSSPMPMSIYVAGNIIYNFLMTYAQIILAMMVVYLIGVHMNIKFSHMLFIGLLMSLVTTSFGTMMAVLFDEELHANLFSSVVALLFSLFGGTFIAFDEMPHLMKSISIISPTRWFIEMAEILESSFSLTLLAPPIALCLLFATGAFTVSAAFTLRK